MSRTLTIVRATVAPELEAEYLATVRELAALGAPHGRRLWVFRSEAEPGVFLECSESATREQHRTVAHLPEGELRLERRLRGLADYGASLRELWAEVPLARAAPAPAADVRESA